jgi:chemotaxis methyl-accepting protein methylase
MMWWWVAVLVAIVSYIAYKALVFFRADGDFTVISKRLKPEYFKGRVIWITGASSGSEYSILGLSMT